MKWDKPDADGVHRLRLRNGYHVASVGKSSEGEHWWCVFGFNDSRVRTVGEAAAGDTAKHSARNAVKLALDILGLAEKEKA